jgi:hypothetical protein
VYTSVVPAVKLTLRCIQSMSDPTALSGFVPWPSLMQDVCTRLCKQLVAKGLSTLSGAETTALVEYLGGPTDPSSKGAYSSV